MTSKFAGILLLLAALVAHAGEVARYKVLAPITHGNLTVFPVVAMGVHDTSEFLTLDEGLRSGDVIVTEAGRLPMLIRGPHSRPYNRTVAEVNTLVLVNNSDR